MQRIAPPFGECDRLTPATPWRSQSTLEAAKLAMTKLAMTKLANF
jgi:hypothetical protein